MEKETTMIIVASIGAIVTIAGWNITHFLSKRRDDRTRRIELVLKHIERQIEKFYGPILSKIEQINTIWIVKERIIANTNSSDTEKVLKLIQDSHFFPLHQQIKEIISSKLYLSEGIEIPDSFRRYIEHSTQQVVKRQLERELGIDTKDVQYVSWPEEFTEDVRNTLEKLMKRYNNYLNELDPKSAYLTEKDTAC